MKKLDIIIILLVLAIGGIIFAFYYNQIKVDVSEAKLEIYYKDIVLDSIDLEQDTYIIYTIEEIDANSFSVTKEQFFSDNTSFKTEDIYQADLTQLKVLNPNHTLHHILLVTWDRIHMEEASCPNKDCQKMLMNHRIALPIICTNGIIVRFVMKDIEIITGA